MVIAGMPSDSSGPWAMVSLPADWSIFLTVPSASLASASLAALAPP